MPLSSELKDVVSALAELQHLVDKVAYGHAVVHRDAVRRRRDVLGEARSEDSGDHLAMVQGADDDVVEVIGGLVDQR